MFAVERRALSQHEIVKLLGYPQSSTTFLLKTMVDSGYLIYDPNDRTYFPTPKVLSIGDWLRETDYGRMDGDGPLADLIRELESLFGETVCLSTQNDTNVYWHRVIARNLPTSLYYPEGHMYALTYSSHGWVLMSRLGEERVDRTCRLVNSREPDIRLRVDPDQAVRRAEHIRQRGYFYHRNTFLVGGSSVSMLLPGKIAGRVVAIGVGGTVERIEKKLDQIVPDFLAAVSNYGARIAAASA
jgi:DNA-binding IclR family transcriptional regulator